MKIRFQAAAQGGPHLQPEVRGAARLLRADGDAEHRDGRGRGDVRLESGAIDERNPPGMPFSAVVRSHGTEFIFHMRTSSDFDIKVEVYRWHALDS